MRGKIGIFLPGLNGDIMSAMSVLKYKDVLWPDKDVIWFCGERFREVLNHNDAIAEVRHWPEGWKLPERCVLENQRIADGLSKDLPWADFSVLMNSDNRLHQDRKHQFESTKDLDEGYFPTPWMMTLAQRHGIDYPNISRKVFGADPAWEWHPYLGFTDQERESVKEFCSKFPHQKTVMMETNFTSGKSHWDDDLTREVIAMCRQKWGKCNIVFACAGDYTRFGDDGVFNCNQFTVRQTALVNNYCDLFTGISSGISVATSCWGNKPTPKIQYCGSFIMSTVSLANGPIELVVADPPGQNPPEHELRFPPKANHREEFRSRLRALLGRL
jgi:hypothetical protein